MRNVSGPQQYDKIVKYAYSVFTVSTRFPTMGRVSTHMYNDDLMTRSRTCPSTMNNTLRNYLLARP